MKSLLSHPMIAGIVGGLPATIVAVVCVFLTYNNTVASQNRQIQIDLIARFDQSSNQIVDAGTMFLSAITENKDLGPAKKVIASLAGRQLLETQDLLRAFGDEKKVLTYQDALKEFNTIADGTQSAADIKGWAESFGHVIDAKIALTDSLYKKIGLRPPPPNA
jgi:hypothetical protein